MDGPCQPIVPRQSADGGALPPHQPGFRSRPGDEVGTAAVGADTGPDTCVTPQSVSLRMFLSSTSRAAWGHSPGQGRHTEAAGPRQNTHWAEGLRSGRWHRPQALPDCHTRAQSSPVWLAFPTRPQMC